MTDTKNVNSSKPKDMSDDDHARFKAFIQYVRTIILGRPIGGKTKRNIISQQDFGVIFFQSDESQLVDFDKAKKQGANIEKGLTKLTFGETVKALGSLRQYIEKEIPIKRKPSRKENENQKTIKDTPTPAAAQLIEAIQISTHLSSVERENLGLPEYSQHPLLKQAFINLVTMPVADGVKLPPVYREIYQLSRYDARSESKAEHVETYKDIKEHLKTKYPSQDESNNLSERAEEILGILNRLFLEAGTGNVRFISDFDDRDQYIRNYIDKQFLDNLCEKYEQNRNLLEKFPVFIENITSEPYGPFPIHHPTDNPYESIFSEKLLALKHSGHTYASIDQQITALPTRTVKIITGHFYIRIPKAGIKRKLPKGLSLQVFQGMCRVVGKDYYLPFTIKVSGIGGTNSLVTRILNRALLLDVACLQQEFFPVFHDLFVNQTNTNQRVLSPVETYSFVKLCRNKTIQQALAASNKNAGIASYEAYCEYDVRGEGNYISFDMVMGAVQAGLIARLSAISNTGIDSDTYLRDIIARIWQQQLFDKATKHLTRYPFSCYAVHGELERSLFNNSDVRKDSILVQNARLLVAEVFINEGAYCKAYEYLKPLHNSLQADSKKDIDWLKNYATRTSVTDANTSIKSGQVMARYELCLGRYLSILDYDAEPKDSDYFLNLFSPREDSKETKEVIIRAAWEQFSRAEQHLSIRLIKYHIVDEISQATFQPYYKLLAQIYNYRAQLLAYYPSLVAPSGSDYVPATQNLIDNKESALHAAATRLFLLERARVFAACYGAVTRYVVYTANQCRSWLTAAYQDFSDPWPLDKKSSERLPKTLLAKDNCLAWAKQLRNHALLQYMETGQRCYNEIKERSGLKKDKNGQNIFRTFGEHEVESICAIRENFCEGEPGYSEEVLSLDMKYLIVERGNVDQSRPNSDQYIYLFGPEACHLFFIRGLYHLCSSTVEEFSQLEPSQKDSALNRAQWKNKLEKCYNLFNYSWSIAGDGCTEIENTSPPGKKMIVRKMTETIKHSDNNHANTVWNLYPFQISEIACIGVVYAAACAALRCYTDDDVATRKREMQRLLDSLPKEGSYETNSVTSMAGQERVNGHLIVYFKRCTKVIRDVAAESEGVPESEIASVRNQLLKRLLSIDALSD